MDAVDRPFRVSWEIIQELRIRFNAESRFEDW